MRFILILITLLFLSLPTAWAQIMDTTQNQTDTSKIEIVNINVLRYKEGPQGTVRELIGNVHLKQKDMNIWCDTGYIYPQKRVVAFGDVQMAQENIRIYADSLFYNGISRQAQLKGNVILQDSAMTMFTDELYYDLNTKVARYPTGALIQSDSAQLISKTGYYDVNTNMAYFSDSVRIAHPSYKLYATDTLSFNTETEFAYFSGPTKIYNEEKIIYCEDGYYDSKSNYADLRQEVYYVNRDTFKRETASADQLIYDGRDEMYSLIGDAKYQDDKQKVEADTIYYDGRKEKYFFQGSPKFESLDGGEGGQSIQAAFSTYDEATETMIFREDVVVQQNGQVLKADSLDYSKVRGEGVARGNVIWQDTAHNMQIFCGQAYYQDSSKYLIADRNPVLLTLVNEDSLWLRSDTLIALEDTARQQKGKDAPKILYAYHDVRIYKSDLQAIADSLVYREADSLFSFFQDPTLWVDSTQFLADTIVVELRNEQIHRVNMLKNSLIIDTPDEVYFNQIKGKNVIARFSNNQVRTMDVQSNGEAVYYALDGEGAYMGVNDIDCSNMYFYFKKNELDRIKFDGAPEAVLYPMRGVSHKKLALDGFQWLEAKRPKNKWAILGKHSALFNKLNVIQK